MGQTATRPPVPSLVSGPVVRSPYPDRAAGLDASEKLKEVTDYPTTAEAFILKKLHEAESRVEELEKELGVARDEIHRAKIRALEDAPPTSLLHSPDPTKEMKVDGSH